jgi:hypothetical protein
MIPSISASAERNHGRQVTSSTRKHLRTGLETSWYENKQGLAHPAASDPVGMRGKPVLLRDAAEQWIKEGKTGDFQHRTGRRLKIRRVRFQAYRLRLVRVA